MSLGPPSRFRWAVVVPNVLTVLRLGLAAAYPFIPMAWRLPVVLIAGLSDGADGIIARRFDGASWIGGILDAVADKVFVLTVLITAVIDGQLELWQMGLLLPRDFAVGVAALWAAVGRRWRVFRKIPARLFGKLTTASLFVLFVLVVGMPHFPDAEVLIGPVFVLAAAFSLFAAIDYTARAVRLWRTTEPGPATD